MTDTPQYPPMQGPVCPVPINPKDTIVIGHGSGGLLTQSLIKGVFQKYFKSPLLLAGNDAARVEMLANLPAGWNLVTSADAHIVTPIIFPGGDIGRLAVCGTVNDVAMLGADVRYLTVTFILEEGLSLSVLETILNSMAQACREAEVEIIAADTKVTQKGQCDKIFISTTGIGFSDPHTKIGGEQAQPGDIVLLSGTIGDHGIAVAEARGNLGFQSNVQSDTAPLNGLVSDLLRTVPEVHVLRDPTRGGLATTLVEIAQQSCVDIALEEAAIPVEATVSKACELLGLDPLYMANEGKLLAIVPPEQANYALEVLQKHPYGKNAAAIGKVEGKSRGRLWLKTKLGTTRVLDMLASEMLPRIC